MVEFLGGASDPTGLPKFTAPVKAQAQQLLNRQLSGRKIDTGLRSTEVRTELRRLQSLPQTRRDLARGAGLKAERRGILAPSVAELTSQQSFARGVDLPQQTVPSQAQSFATIADIQQRPPPTNVIRAAPTRGQQFKEFVGSRNPITGTLSFAGEKTQGFITQRETRGDFGFSRGGQSLAGTGLISTGVQVAPFLTPAGAGLALATGVGQFTPSGIREAQAVGSSFESQTGLPSVIGTTGFLGLTTGFGLLGIGGSSRQVSQVIGLPRSEVQVLGRSTQVESFPQSSFSFFTKTPKNLATQPKSFFQQKLTKVKEKVGLGERVGFELEPTKPQTERFLVTSEADALVTTKSNILLPQTKQFTKLESRTIVDKSIGEDIFGTKTVFSGSSEQLKAFPIRSGRTKFGSIKDFQGVSFGTGQDIKAQADLIIKSGDNVLATTAQSKGFFLKELTKVSPRGKVGDITDFGSGTLALGTETQIGIASSGKQLIPQLGGGFKVRRGGTFKTEGIFQVGKPPKPSDIFSTGGRTTTKQVAKPKASFQDLLVSTEEVRIGTIARQTVPPPRPTTSSIFKPTTVSVTESPRQLFTGVPQSQFQGRGQFERTTGGLLPGELTQPIQPTSSNIFNFQTEVQPLAFGFSSRGATKLALDTGQQNIFGQSAGLSSILKQSESTRQGFRTLQAPATRQTQRGRTPTRPTTPFGRTTTRPPFFITPGIIPPFISGGASRGRGRRTPSGFSLFIGRSPSLDALGLGIFGRKAPGEFSGAGSLVSRPILLPSPTKKKKKRRKKK